VLVVDAANVVGSRPTGWWRDRPGATATLHGEIVAAVRAGRLAAPVVLVLEGAARPGAGEGDADGVRVVHAEGEGDDDIVAIVTSLGGAGETKAVTVVTADRGLRARVAGRAQVVGPRWLLDRL
jgi:hypothetical protein